MKRWQILKMGLQTLCTQKPLGFFIPYRYAHSTNAGNYPALLPLFEQAHSNFQHWIDQVSQYAEELRRFGGAAPNPRFEQDWFPRLDAAVGYAMIRENRPNRVIEIGSGHSTRVMSRAILDAKLNTQLICIDPEPRAALLDLPVTHIAETLQTANWPELAKLEPNDILFVDSSHISMPGTDVDYVASSVIPLLPKGCLLHFHDIFLPHGYPSEWAWRGYNEQTVVSVLAQSDSFELIFASHYVSAIQPQLLKGTIIEELPLPKGAFESSLWLRKLSGSVHSANQNVSGR